MFFSSKIVQPTRFLSSIKGLEDCPKGWMNPVMIQRSAYPRLCAILTCEKGITSLKEKNSDSDKRLKRHQRDCIWRQVDLKKIII
jgi:hypothetical protein